MKRRTWIIGVFALFSALCLLSSCQEKQSDGSCDHLFKQWTVTKAPSCTEGGVHSRACKKCGLTETREVPPAHKWSDVSCTEIKFCTVCNAMGGWGNHSWAEQSCTADMICTVCKVNAGPGAHNFKDGFCTFCGLPVPSDGLAYALDGDAYTVIGIGSCKDSQVNVPQSHQGKPVRAIAEKAFENCTQLRSVTIQDSVKSIGFSAFGGCTKLESITLPFVGASDKEGAPSHLGYIFGAKDPLEHREKIPASLHTLNIAGGRSLEKDALKDCVGLTAISLHGDFEFIADHVFEDTGYYLDEKNRKDGVLYIGSYLLEADTALSGHYTVKDGTAYIAEGAFKGCTKLTGVTLPNSIKGIGIGAFEGCTGIQSLSLPFVGDSKFSPNATYVGYLFGAKSYEEHSQKLPKGFKTVAVTGSGKIPPYAFYNCTALTEVTISNGVNQIGECAFMGCTKLTSFTVPDTVSSIGASAFKGCTGLQSMKLPFIGGGNGDPSQGFSASFKSFGYIFGAKTLSENRSSIPASLKTVELTKGVRINEDAFYSCTGLERILLPKDILRIESYAFSHCTGLTSITIPDSVKSIGSSAFSGCSGLTSIDIPDSVTSIGNYAFSNCTGLTTVTLDSGLTKVAERMFENCTNLNTVVIGNAVTSIEKHAFSGCTNLTTVVLPDSVTSIEVRAFNACKKLTTIVLPDSLTTISTELFYECTALTNVIVGSNVTVIEDSAFKGCMSLKSVHLPNNVTTIKEWAFSYCTGLESVTIGNGVTDIGASAFKGCVNLQNVRIGKNVKNIGSAAFFNCKALNAVYVTDLSAWCNINFESTHSTNPLYYAKHLYVNGQEVQTLILPEEVTSIGARAFTGCALAQVILHDGVKTVGKDAFFDCASLTNVWCQAPELPESWDPSWLGNCSATVHWGDSWEYVNGVPALK